MKQWLPLIFSVMGCIVIAPATSAFGAASSISPKQEAPSTVGLGHIDFPTSGIPEAQQWFLRGVLLLHNFQYDDAQEAFLQAQELEPTFAMAYWGEAMTENHPLWNEQNLRKGQQILKRLNSNLDIEADTVLTTREKKYLQAIHALYGEGEASTRNHNYVTAMHQLVDEFPDDLEAAAFYALAILGSTEGERDTATYMKAAAIAEGVFRQNPRHPGAVHYLIHSYDDPIHAPLGLHAARIYSSLAPAASHAQHMPSHIFMALGMWDEVIAANEAAWASSEARIKRKNLTIASRPYHTLKWLLYAYLQAGNKKEAQRVLKIIQDDAQQTQSRYIRGYYAAMRAMYIIETQEWSIRHSNEDRSRLRFSFAASALFALGMSAVNMHDLPLAKQVLSELHERINSQQSSSLSRDGTAGLSMAKELEAMILLKEFHSPETLMVLQEAVALEDSLPFDYGPPLPLKPSHELLGETYVQLNQPDKAKKEFGLALKRAPKRRLSLMGLQKLKN